MTERFSHDRLANEKNDPAENSSLRLIKIPIVLLSIFVGFGVTYLALRTDRLEFTPGDSRTQLTSGPEQAGPTKTSGTDDPATMMENGKNVFTTTCQPCHQENGQGIPGAFPPLDGSEWVGGPAKQVVAIILHGIQGQITVSGQKFESVMPPFKQQLSEEQVAAVATFIRQSWSNKGTAVNPELVHAVVEATASRTTSWTGETELKSQDWKD